MSLLQTTKQVSIMSKTAKLKRTELVSLSLKVHTN